MAEWVASSKAASRDRLREGLGMWWEGEVNDHGDGILEVEELALTLLLKRVLGFDA